MHSPEGGKEFLSVMVDPCSNDSLMWAEDSRNDLTYQNGLKGGSIFEKAYPSPPTPREFLVHSTKKSWPPSL